MYSAIMLSSIVFRKLCFCAWVLVAAMGVGVCVSAAIAAPIKQNPLVGKDRDYAKDAFIHAGRENWKDALLFAKKADDRMVYDLIVWTYLMEGSTNPGFEPIRAFHDYYPDWPGERTIRRRAEEALEFESPDTVIAWLGKHPPVSSRGKLLLAQARIAKKPTLERDLATLTLLREGFVGIDFNTTQEESAFIEKYGKKLREQDYAARIDRLLWEGKITPARRVMDKVGAARQKLYNARIMLMQDTKKAEDFAREVAPSLKGDPGLLYERIKWRQRRGAKDDLEAKLLALPKKLDYPEKWWALKNPYIYRFISQKRYKEAYTLAKNHNSDKGIIFAEGEFLSGWIALRFLNEPRVAYRHFYTLYNGVETPISRARAAYWAARAAHKNGNKDIEANWLLVASQFPTVFYGQLASIRRGDTSLSIHKQPEATKSDHAAFARNKMVKAAQILDAYNRRNDAKEFLKAALETSKTLGERLLITRYGMERGEMDLTVAVSKHAANIGTVLMETGYPVLNEVRSDGAPEPALVHAIIRQESMFDPEAKSPAGALGLMQLMPATAKHVAPRAGHKFSKDKLTSDPKFNIALGSRYLEDMVDNYGGSYILGVAAYNAGPGNVSKWLKEMGDPRLMDDPDMIVDWIEMMPFKETRNYVQRVLEALQIYRHSLAPGKPAQNAIVEDLKRRN